MNDVIVKVTGKKQSASALAGALRATQEVLRAIVNRRSQKVTLLSLKTLRPALECLLKHSNAEAQVAKEIGKMWKLIVDMMLADKVLDHKFVQGYRDVFRSAAGHKNEQVALATKTLLDAADDMQSNVKELLLQMWQEVGTSASKSSKNAALEKMEKKSSPVVGSFLNRKFENSPQHVTSTKSTPKRQSFAFGLDADSQVLLLIDVFFLLLHECANMYRYFAGVRAHQLRIEFGREPPHRASEGQLQEKGLHPTSVQRTVAVLLSRH